MEPVNLLVVVVNWRSSDLVADCLRSMVDEVAAVGACRVCVVDNDSGDGSAEKLERLIADSRWSDWACVVRSSVNGGFAAGNNLGIREMHSRGLRPDHVLLLNPDTLVRPYAFRVLLDFLESHPDVGIAGGRSEDPDATPQECCFRFPNMLSEFAGYLGLGLFDRLVRRRLARPGIPEVPTEVDWVSGALMLIRWRVFEDIGLMDEGYFLYYEETDFTLRARRAGWRCWHVPQSRIVHLVGQSSGLSSRDARPPRRPGYWFESRRRYFVLNHGRLYAAVTDTLVLSALVVNTLRRLVQPGRGSGPPRFMRDFISYFALVARDVRRVSRISCSAKGSMTGVS